jgi:hypothetical protein
MEKEGKEKEMSIEEKERKRRGRNGVWEKECKKESEGGCGNKKRGETIE